MAEFESKHGIVSRPPYALYMAFVDMRNFVNMLPEDKKQGIEADYDSIHATVQGYPIGIKITDRTPYSKIELADDGAPFAFSARLYFDAVSSDPNKTDFYINADADLNFMMKMMIGNKIKEALDKMVDSLVDMSQKM